MAAGVSEIGRERGNERERELCITAKKREIKEWLAYFPKFSLQNYRQRQRQRQRQREK